MGGSLAHCKFQNRAYTGLFTQGSIKRTGQQGSDRKVSISDRAGTGKLLGDPFILPIQIQFNALLCMYVSYIYALFVFIYFI